MHSLVFFFDAFSLSPAGDEVAFVIHRVARPDQRCWATASVTSISAQTRTTRLSTSVHYRRSAAFRPPSVSAQALATAEIGLFAAGHYRPSTAFDERPPIVGVADCVQLGKICGRVRRLAELVDADRCKSSHHCYVGPSFGDLFNGASERPPPQLKPTTIARTAPAAAPCKRRVSECPCR